MDRILPPDVASRSFDRALGEFAKVVGSEWVLSSNDDCAGYLDPFPLGDPLGHSVSAAIAPASVEEIQGLLAVARQFRIPLWPISCGKNHGYGGAAPRLKGSVVLDLKRMNRIIEVDERLGYAIVEPGVTFFQLYDFLAQKEIKLWLSTPAPGWGSIIGNALERGVGYTPYGDHAGMQCGMEVVLANGNVVRTGMGAKAGNSTWALYEYGFGPSWDKVFTQSNFGVVTKMGIWLMPEPEATANVSITVPNAADLPAIIDVLRPLRIGQAINSNPVIANAIRRLAATSIRSDWYDGDGAMPEDMLAEIMRRNGWNFWEVTIPFYDSEAVIDARVETVRKAFSSIAGATFEVKRWRRGEPLSGSAARIPNLNAYMILNWRGGKGAHISFAPVCAMTGTEANRIYGLMNQRVREFGFDYYGGFTLFQRHMVHTALIVFDAADRKMANDAYRLFATVVSEAADLGFVEYRAHVDFMDHIADAYDFNDHALMKLNETVKDALDPDGILAPGKQGIWPARLRTQRK